MKMILFFLGFFMFMVIVLGIGLGRPGGGPRGPGRVP